MDTPYEVTIRSEIKGEPDQYGNPQITSVDRSERVYGWYPAGTDEIDQRSSQVTHDMVLLTPPLFQCDPSAVVILPDGDYEIEGRLEDFNHGPFAWVPGGRVRLRKVTG